MPRSQITLSRMETKRKPENLKEALGSLLPWLLFLLSAYLLLRPVLLTTVAADDLINPFSQMYHAGTTLGPIWRRVKESVSVTGHFNYLGQLFGSIVVLLWSYLIGNFGFRFSLVYALTKYVFFVLAIMMIASYARSVLRDSGRHVPTWTCRAVALAALAFPLQLHIPWSNDPTASYPMAGYGTALFGLLFLFLCRRALVGNQWRNLLVVGITGSAAVLYYECNSFAVLATVVFFVERAWGLRSDRRLVLRELARYLICVGPAAATTLYFFFKNRAASANYSGTSLRLSTPFLEKFRNGIVSSTPGSSWPLAHDWLGHTTRFNVRILQFFFAGLVTLAVLIWITRNKKPNTSEIPTGGWQRLLVAVLPAGIYWLGATFAQTATKKVQDESQRIGQVYNYYAVGSVAISLIVVVMILGIVRAHHQFRLRVFFSTAFVVVGCYQYATNLNVLLRFNEAMKPTSNLLVTFAERPEMAERCARLDQWKAMGWPEYYWLDLELGMNMMYQLNHQEDFCRR